MLSIKKIYLTLVTVLLLQEVRGHGRLRKPAARGTMWRDNWPTAINYDDNGLNCGGYQYQWEQYNGQCGICGDPFNDVRKHEWGGIYMSGIVVEHYRKGQNITIEIELTSNHRGYMQFRLCEYDTASNPATQACLDQHLLPLSNGNGTKYDIDTWRAGMWYVNVTLPPQLTCPKCVLQWKYVAGNSYGTDQITGESCVGCGNQEQFYGCADVKISELGGVLVTPSSPAPVTTASTTTIHPIYCPDGRYVSSYFFNTVDVDNWCQATCQNNPCDSATCRCEHPPSPGETYRPRPSTTVITTTATLILVCIDHLYEPTPAHQSNSAMQSYCQVTCTDTLHPYCPTSHCQCVNPESTSYV